MKILEFIVDRASDTGITGTVPCGAEEGLALCRDLHGKHFVAASVSWVNGQATIRLDPIDHVLRVADLAPPLTDSPATPAATKQSPPRSAAE